MTIKPCSEALSAAKHARSWSLVGVRALEYDNGFTAVCHRKKEKKTICRLGVPCRETRDAQASQGHKSYSGVSYVQAARREYRMCVLACVDMRELHRCEPTADKTEREGITKASRFKHFEQEHHRPYRDAQNKLLWRETTCPAHT